MHLSLQYSLLLVSTGPINMNINFNKPKNLNFLSKSKCSYLNRLVIVGRIYSDFRAHIT